jgi:LysM repeat protein
MTNLKTQAQCTALAKAAGFSDAASKKAGAIAMCEALTFVSGKQYSDFDIVGDQNLATDTWGYSYGGWQVRSLRAQKGTGGIRDEDELADPEFNAASAFAIYKSAGYSFKPWSTFNSGAYLGFLQDSPEAVVPAGSYRVTGGDTLSRIGSRLGYAWRDIAKVNRIVDPYTIYPGQVLLMPDFPHTVVSGDTLTNIASKYGSNLTATRLAEYNGLSLGSTLQIGQVIKVPRL